MRYGAASALMMVIGVVIGAAGCGKGPAMKGPGGMAVPVVVFRALQRPVEDRVAVVGTLSANESVDIKSEVEGPIESISFEEGQLVKQGQVLFEIDRAKLKASLAEVEANFKLAEATQGRYAALAQSRAVSQQEADQARLNYEARLAAVELVRAQLSDATIVAPFDGVAGSRLVSLGQFVSKGQLLTSLIDADPVKVECDVPERFISQMATGQELDVRIAAYPDTTFRGTVYFVDPSVDPNTRTVRVKARIPNPKGQLRPGMFADLDLVLRVRERAVVIPESAVLLAGERASVFVVEDGKAQPRSITAGVRLAGAVEILAGISVGELVIIEGTQKLGPGAPVSVREDDRPLEEMMRERASPSVAVTER